MGSIPASAGEPAGSDPDQWRIWVYPRVCGGTPRALRLAWYSRGLSPRLRGNRFVPGPGYAVAGSIPASAGEPATDSWHRRALRVYPRVCGGTVLNPSDNDYATGLSPRLRGNPLQSSPYWARSGSIPASAGEPRAPLPSRSPHGVYPRVCGGTTQFRSGWSPYLGLSPRLRGNRSSRPGPPYHTGSIPASAGEP